MPKTRKPYPPEFREQLVALVQAGRTPEDLAREFEPTAQSISNWVAQADRDAGRRTDGLTTAERTELTQLRRENRQLKVERDILSKAAAWFAQETQTEQMAPIDLVAALVTDELQRRQDRLLARRHTQARFRDADRALDSFDFTCNKKMNRSLVYELATARFIAQREDALFLGPPASAPLRRKRTMAHDVEALFSTVVTPGSGARHPVDHVHGSSVPGCEPVVSPTISEVTVTDQQPTAQAPDGEHRVAFVKLTTPS